MGDPVIAWTANPLDEGLEESGRPIDALENEGKGRVLRGQGEPCPFAGEGTKDAVERRAEIDKENHRD